MPTEVVDTKEDEEKWEKAKDEAAQQGHEDDWAYIMSIYKNMCPDHEFDEQPDHCARIAKLEGVNIPSLYKNLQKLGSVDPTLRPKIYPLLVYLSSIMQ